MPNSRRTKIRIRTHEITIIRLGANTRVSSPEPSAEEPDVRAFEQELVRLADESAVETNGLKSGYEVKQLGEEPSDGNKTAMMDQRSSDPECVRAVECWVCCKH